MTGVLEGGVMRENVLGELASRAATDPEFLERTREGLEGTLARCGYHLTDGEMQLVSNLRHQSTGMSSEELAGTLAAGLAGRDGDPPPGPSHRVGTVRDPQDRRPQAADGDRSATTPPRDPHEGRYCAVRRIELTIHHLYADMMNLYGDRGNVISIKKRCEWRGIPVEVVDVGLGEKVRPNGCDLFLFGGGQDREQALLAEDLSGSKGSDLRNIVEDGGVVLGVCGGYQLMGHYYETPEGEKLPGVGIFDLHTEPREPDEERLIGNVLVRVPAPETGGVREVVGFENHGGRTYLGDTEPLGEVVVGHGNNGEDGTEGARRLNAYGTYMHGSLLPKNPWLTDQLLLSALRQVDDTFELAPLDDGAERSAFVSVAGRISRRR
jgi:CobQ-like glutamine amidotransferase family enzyme